MSKTPIESQTKTEYGDLSLFKEMTVPEDGDPRSHNADLAPQLNTSQNKKPAITLWCRLLSFFGLKDCEATYKDALQEVLEEHAEELVNSPEEGKMISNLLDFGEIEVEDIMTPQTDIIAVELGSNLQQIREVMVKEQHTRIPVYEQTIDKVRGFIHVKDLVPLLGNGNHDFTINKILREILFIPVSMKLTDLLLKMRVAGVHMAIVVDEYGGTKGLVTLEDLFEEIVGEIQDEHDEELKPTKLEWDSRNSITVDAKMRIDELSEQLGIAFSDEDEEEDFDSLGGLIVAQLGRVPTKGESIQHASGVRMEIVDADARRIRKVRLLRKVQAKKVAV